MLHAMLRIAAESIGVKKMLQMLLCDGNTREGQSTCVAIPTTVRTVVTYGKNWILYSTTQNVHITLHRKQPRSTSLIDAQVTIRSTVTNKTLQVLNRLSVDSPK